MSPSEVDAFIEEVLVKNFPAEDRKGQPLLGPGLCESYRRVLRTYTRDQAEAGVNRLIDQSERNWRQPPMPKQIAQSASEWEPTNRFVSSKLFRILTSDASPAPEGSVTSSGICDLASTKMTSPRSVLASPSHHGPPLGQKESRGTFSNLTSSRSRNCWSLYSA